MYISAHIRAPSLSPPFPPQLFQDQFQCFLHRLTCMWAGRGQLWTTLYFMSFCVLLNPQFEEGTYLLAYATHAASPPQAVEKEAKA